MAAAENWWSCAGFLGRTAKFCLAWWDVPDSLAEVVTSAVLLLGLYQVQQRSVPFMRAFTQALGMSRRYSTTGEPLADSDTPKAGTR